MAGANLLLVNMLVVGILRGCSAEWSPATSNLSCSDGTYALQQQDQADSALNAFSSWLNDTLVQNSTGCNSALQNLSTCHSESALSSRGEGANPDDISLSPKDTCCSRACASALDKALITSGPGCYRSFLETICNNTLFNSSTSGVLVELVQHCTALNASCVSLDEPGSLMPADLEARAINSTAGSNDNTADGGTRARRAPPVLNIPVPDPFQLVPQNDSSVVLATPEEIAEAAAARRRPLTAGRHRAQ